MKKLKKIQQGDVVIRPIDSYPGGEIKLDDQAKDKILAFGEVTGHKHQIIEGEAEVFWILNKLYINALTECKVSHEEHNEVILPAGRYKTNIVRETDWLTRVTRRVVD